MYARHDDDGRNGDDYPREPSPSTGAEETARILGGRDGYDHEPASDDDAEPVTIDAVPPADTDADSPDYEVLA